MTKSPDLVPGLLLLAVSESRLGGMSRVLAVKRLSHEIKRLVEFAQR
jgi:hypothetical protein